MPFGLWRLMYILFILAFNSLLSNKWDRRCYIIGVYLVALVAVRYLFAEGAVEQRQDVLQDGAHRLLALQGWRPVPSILRLDGCYTKAIEAPTRERQLGQRSR